MRIVSLCPSLTELVFDLGGGDALVGRTKFCVHPADRVTAVEAVGGTKNPKLDRIVALRPDLVLLNAEENREEDARALERAGVRLHVSMPRTVPETAAMVRDIATAIGATAAGEDIARDIEARAARVHNAARGAAPVRYAYLIWREPWMTVNDDTFIAHLLALPGGVNAFGGAPERYPTITLDALREAAPDVVLLSSEPFPFGARHVEELSSTLGWARERLCLVDGERLSWHGSRTPAGIDLAESVIAGVRATPR